MFNYIEDFNFDCVYAKNYSLAEYNYLFFCVAHLRRFNKYHLMSKVDFFIEYQNCSKLNKAKVWTASLSFDDKEFVLVKSLRKTNSHNHEGKDLIQILNMEILEDSRKKEDFNFLFKYNKEKDCLTYNDSDVLLLSLDTMKYILTLEEIGNQSGDCYMFLDRDVISLITIVSVSEHKNIKIKYQLKKDLNDLNNFEMDIKCFFDGYKNFGFIFCKFLCFKNEKVNDNEINSEFFQKIEDWLKHKNDKVESFEDFMKEVNYE